MVCGWILQYNSSTYFKLLSIEEKQDVGVDPEMIS